MWYDIIIYVIRNGYKHIKRGKNMTEKSFDTIVSVLIDSKIIAMKFNKDGINDNYIENINFALSELKEIKNNGKITQ